MATKKNPQKAARPTPRVKKTTLYQRRWRGKKQAALLAKIQADRRTSDPAFQAALENCQRRRLMLAQVGFRLTTNPAFYTPLRILLQS